MRIMSVDEIIGLLPSLNKQEQNKIRAVLDALSRNTNDGPGPLYDILCHVARARIPFSHFCKSSAYRPWKLHEQEIMLFIEKYWGAANKITQNSLKHFLLDMLADDLRSRGIKVTVGTLARNAGEIPALFEQQFPGYLANGLASVILYSMVMRNGKTP